MMDEKVKELAETLKKSGIAVSDYEAKEKAKAILGTDIQNKEEEPMKEKVSETTNTETPEKIIEEATSQKEPEKEGFLSHLKEKFHHKKNPEPKKHEFSEPDYDISKEDLTVNDLMKEVGVNPEDISEKEEKIADVQEKISELKEELIEEQKNPEEEKVEEIKHKIEDIKEEVQEIEEEKTEEKQEDKKIDLSKVFDSSEKE